MVHNYFSSLEKLGGKKDTKADVYASTSMKNAVKTNCCFHLMAFFSKLSDKLATPAFN